MKRPIARKTVVSPLAKPTATQCLKSGCNRCAEPAWHMRTAYTSSSTASFPGQASRTNRKTRSNPHTLTASAATVSRFGQITLSKVPSTVSTPWLLSFWHFRRRLMICQNLEFHGTQLSGCRRPCESDVKRKGTSPTPFRRARKVHQLKGSETGRLVLPIDGYGNTRRSKPTSVYC